ncbi:MAG: hypothetical protein RIF46_17300 [Cyclobacteriaceae bacterium]
MFFWIREQGSKSGEGSRWWDVHDQSVDIDRYNRLAHQESDEDSKKHLMFMGLLMRVSFTITIICGVLLLLKGWVL